MVPKGIPVRHEATDRGKEVIAMLAGISVLAVGIYCVAMSWVGPGLAQIGIGVLLVWQAAAGAYAETPRQTS